MSRTQLGFSRRVFAAGVGGAAAAVVGFRVSSAAQEATPAPLVEHYDVTGVVHRFSVGDFQCLAVSDGSALNNDPNDVLNYYGLLFGVSDPDEVQAALDAGGYDVNNLVRQDTPVLIDAGDQLVLIDTGFGAALGGALLSNLEGEGIAAEDIDIVIATHGHPDHIGGNVDEAGAPTFANARYVMAQEEWDFWTDTARVEQSIPNEVVRDVVLGFVEAQMLPLSDQYDVIGFEEEITPGVTSIATPGHTPGHMSVLVQSGEEKLWVVGDAITHPVNLPHPELVGFSDTDPGMAADTRQDLLQRMTDEGGLGLFFHFDPFPGLGHVSADGNAWRWNPVANEA